MSKNMTRKGLAFGAGIALAASGVAGAPAQAANVSGVSLDAYYGPADEFVALQDVDLGLVLETELTNIGNVNPSTLKYLVEIVQTSDFDAWGDIDGTPEFNTLFASALAAGTTQQFEGTNENNATVTQVGASTTSRVITPTDMGADRTFTITSATVLGTDDDGTDDNTADLIIVSAGHDLKVGETVSIVGVNEPTDGTTDEALDSAGYEVTAVTNNSATLKLTVDLALDDTDYTAGAAPLDLVATASAAAVPSVSETNLLYIGMAPQELDGTAGDREPASFKVTAWLDGDGDNVIGANEYASPTRTVTFVAEEDVTFVHNVDFFTVGDSALGGNWYASGVNTQNLVEMLKENEGFGFEIEAGKGDVNDQKTDNTDGTAVANATHAYNATFDRYDYTFDATAVSNMIDGDGDVADKIDADDYEFVLLIDDGADKEPGDADGAGVYFTEGEGNTSDTNIAKTASASSLNKMEIVAATSATIGQNDAAAGNSLIEEAETVELLTGTTSIPFTIDLYTAATTRAGSGIEVEVTITDVTNNLDTTTLTVDGLTLSATTAGDSVSFTKKTDANGQIAFTIAADKGANGESFRINAKAGDKAIDQTTVQWADRDYKLVQTPDTNFTIDTQGTVTVEYAVVDQFNQVPSGDYQLAFTRARSSGLRTDAKGTTANWSYVAPLSATGRASVTIVDNGSATVEGVDTVTATLQKAATGGTGFVSEPNHTADTFTVTYETDLDGISTTAQVSNNGVAILTTPVYPVELEAKVLKDVDTRFGDVDPLYSDTNAFNNKNDTTADTLLRVYGTVTDTGNDGVSGVAVELSAPGLNFANANTSAGATLMLNDSIVVTTDANGLWQAWVRSAVSGKQTISVDAQGATASATVTFEGSTGTASAMTLDVASSVIDGRTADIKATVVDAFGNPVEGVAVTFKEAGPGYLNTASGTTDADGEVIVNLITVSGDTGSSTITASATLGGVSSSVSKTVTVGATAAASDQKVNAGSFKGYVALYAKGYAGKRMSAKVGNDWVVVPVLASNFERVVEFTGAGYTVAVRIYIDRVLIDTITVTTK